MSQILTIGWFPILLLVTGATLSVLGTALAMYQQTEAESHLRQKTEEIVGVVTSGNSYPRAIVTNPSNDRNIFDLMVMNEGDNPLYDVQVRIVDTVAMNKKIEENLAAGLPLFISSDKYTYETIINIGTIGPRKTVSSLGYRRITTDEDQEFGFSFFFNHRYGATSQTISGKRREDGSWSRIDQIQIGDDVVRDSKDEDYDEIVIKAYESE